MKQAAWGADRYKSNSAEENYQRYRRLLIARIEYKRERITQLEVELNA